MLERNEVRRLAMVIETTTPEIEVLIQQRLQAGGFKDAEDVVLQALRSMPAGHPGSERIKAIQSMTFSELFAPLRGLNIDFEQDRQAGRDFEL